MTTDPDFEDLWQEALDTYKVKAGRKRQEMIGLQRLNTLHDLDSLELELQTDRTSFVDFRQKHGKLTGRLKAVAKPFLVLSDMASGALSASPFAPASTVLGAIVFVVKAADGVTQAYDWIEQLFDKLGDFTNRLNQYLDSGPLTVQLRTKVVEILGCILEILACSETAIKKKRFKEFAAVFFLGSDEGVKEAFEKLEEFFQGEQRLLMAITYAMNQSMSSRVDQLLDSTGHIVTRLDKTEFQKHFVEVLEWISPKGEQFMDRQAEVLARREKGTALWFREAPEFKDWMRRDSSSHILYCPGLPGSGKTTVAAAIVEHLNDLRATDDSAVATAFFDYRQRSTETENRLMCSILRQLLQIQESIPPEVEATFRLHERDGIGPTSSEVAGMLNSVVSFYTIVYLVVDAIDEAEDKMASRFLRNLQQLRTGRNVKILLTSRILESTERMIVKWLGASISLQITATDQDIEQLFETRWDEWSDCPRSLSKDKGLKTLAKNTIVNAAGGMFLLARLHIDRLQGLATAKEVRQMLNKEFRASRFRPADLTTQYEEAYDSAMSRIKEQSPSKRRLAMDALVWLTFSHTLLRDSALCHVLALEDGEASIDPDNVPEINQIISYCAGLITIDEKSNIVRLVHYTTQEYLFTNIDKWRPQAGLYVASSSLAYMSLRKFLEYPVEVEGSLEGLEDTFPFLHYAARHWGDHLRPFQKNLADHAWDILQSGNIRQLTMTACVGYVSKYLDGLGNIGWAPEVERTTSLSVIAYFGLVHLHLHRPALSEPYSNSNIHIDPDFDPLKLAAAQGHTEMVTLLINEGATQGQMQLALQTAAANDDGPVISTLISHGTLRGDELVKAAGLSLSRVKLLLGLGYDVNFGGRLWSWPTPLQAAVEQHRDRYPSDWRTDDRFWEPQNRQTRLETVHLLLAQGALVNGELDTEAGSALERAAATGDEKVVQLLLDHGAEVDAFGQHGRTALTAAVMNGCLQICKMLLSNGADPTLPVITKLDPFAINEKDHRDSVGLLLLSSLEHGIDPNELTSSDELPLECAASLGLPEVAETLLDHGALPNKSSGNLEGNALQRAAAEGHADVVRVLLAKGADADLCAPDVPPPLHLAAAKGKVDTLEVLLDSGARSDVRHGNDQLNALDTACYNLQVASVEMLLRKGANASALGGKFGSALGTVCSHESYWWETEGPAQFEVAELLVQHGAAVEASSDRTPADSDDNPSALQRAILGADNEELVALLLRNGARTDIATSEYGNILHTATAKGRIGAMKALLDSGEDINAKGLKYENILLTATESVIKDDKILLTDGVEIVRTLCDRGVNLHGYGSRALELCCKRYQALVLGTEGDEKSMEIRINRVEDILFAQDLTFASSPPTLLQTLLHRAVARGKIDRCVTLFKAGASASASSEDIHCTLCALCKSRQGLEAKEAGRKSLVSYSADLNFPSPLPGVVEGLEVAKAMLKCLIEHGADVNCPIALQMAVGEGDLELLRILLDHGADPNSRGGEDGPAMLSARVKTTWCQEEVELLLKRYGATE